MSDLLQTLINTLAVGGLYALIALGYTLVYGILRFINFAHSDIVAWGGWVAFTVASGLGFLAGESVFAMPLVMLLTMGICAAMGVTIELLAYRPLRKAPRLNVLITAIGVSLLLQNFGLLDHIPGLSKTQDVFPFGNRPSTMKSLLPNSVLGEIGDVQIRLYDVLMIVLAVVLVVALERLVYKTKLGRAMRAVSFDERTAALMGINVNMVVSVTFAIGSALAAAGGLLFALRNDLRMTADSTWVLLGLKAFVAAVVGGIGNVRGAAAGALLIAFVEVFVHRYVTALVPGSTWVGQLQDVYVFVILIVVLLWRPSGLFGKSTVEKV